MNTKTSLHIAEPTLRDLAGYLRRRLAVPDGDDVPLYWRPGAAAATPVRRIGLALERRSCLHAGDSGVDALFLHRPFLLPDHVLPGVPVLASHRGFDAHLSVGYSPALAEALGLCPPLEPLHRADKGGARVGMIGNLAEPESWYALRARLTAQFGGAELILPGRRLAEGGGMVDRMAVVGAMTPELLAEAADRGAQVFLTGQFREGSRKAAEASGVAVFAAGHRRAERWGMVRLASELTAAFPGLKAAVLD